MKIKCYDALPDESMNIRKTVFVEEQGFIDEFDEIDTYANHLVMYDGDLPIATCRFFKEQGKEYYLIGRIAVIKNYRGQNLGTQLLREAEKIIFQNGGNYIALHSQLQAKHFYEKQGYLPYGEVDYDESCPHIWMYKKITT